MKLKKIGKLNRLGLAGIGLLFFLNTQPNYNYNWYEIDDSKISKEVDTAKEVEDWIWGSNKNIQYEEHDGRCLFPQETLDEGVGDCKQKAALALAIFYKRCGKKGSLLVGEVKTNGSEKKHHIEVDYCGETFYDESWFKPIGEEYKFDDMVYFPFFYKGESRLAKDK